MRGNLYLPKLSSAYLPDINQILACISFQQRAGAILISLGYDYVNAQCLQATVAKEVFADEARAPCIQQLVHLVMASCNGLIVPALACHASDPRPRLQSAHRSPWHLPTKASLVL